MSTFAPYVYGSGSMIENDYLQFYVGSDMEDSEDNGRFTIGNTGGNPNSTSDNNKILLYGHPNPWSSYTTIRIDNNDYIFNSNNTTYDTTNLKAVSTMAVDGVFVTQTLQIINNATTGIIEDILDKASRLPKTINPKKQRDWEYTTYYYADGSQGQGVQPKSYSLTHEIEVSLDDILQKTSTSKSLTDGKDLKKYSSGFLSRLFRKK
jgi:hypothetical protein